MGDNLKKSNRSISSSQQSIVFILEQGLICGGAERVASLLINSWIDKGIAVSLVTRDDSSGDYYKISDKVVRYNIGYKSRKSNIVSLIHSTLMRIVRLRRILKISQSNVAVAFMTAANIRLILASFRLPIRIVICERNDVLSRKIPYFQRILRFLLYRFSDLVTANTEESVLALSLYCDKKQVIYIPNPVKQQNADNCQIKDRIILAVGRLHPIKNQALLISAFKAISDKYADWSLVIAGEGTERENLELLIRTLELTGRVKLVGQISNIDELYQRSTIYVITSVSEGTPNTLLEAMSHGLPAIVPNNLPGALAYVKHLSSGYVFNANEIGSLSNGLDHLISQPQLCKKLGMQARISISSFSLESVSDIWLDVLFNKPHSLRNPTL